MSFPERKKRKKASSMSFPEIKNRKKEPSKSPTAPIPSLPYDLVSECVARVSRLYYPTLSLVSKSFRSLITSPDLYKTRSLLGHKEICLYVCLDIIGNKNPTTLFTLCRKPNQTLTNEEETNKKKYVLARVPIPNSPNLRYSGIVAVGSNIYTISRSKTYSKVSILDCTSHKWSMAPSLPVELNLLSTTVVDQKIYVARRYNFLDCIYHVLDTKTQTWDTLPIGTKNSSSNKTASIDGKFHVATTKKVVAYDSNEGRWNVVGEWPGFYWASFGSCVIDNVLYSSSSQPDIKLEWYDTEGLVWRHLKGLVGLPNLPRAFHYRLADYGGKMAVLWWDDSLSKDQKTKIWCAEITLERRNSCEIWGNVEWFDHVLTVQGNFDFLKVIVASV